MIFEIKTNSSLEMVDVIVLGNIAKYSAKKYGDEYTLTITSKSGNIDTHMVSEETYEDFKKKFSDYLNQVNQIAVDGKISVDMLADIKQAAEQQAMESVQAAVDDVTKNLSNVSNLFVKELTNVSGSIEQVSKTINRVNDALDSFPTKVKQAHTESVKEIKSGISAVTKPIEKLGEVSHKLSTITDVLHDVMKDGEDPEDGE